METYKEKMKRKVDESKSRHDYKCQEDNRLGNAIIAVMTIVGGIFATITFAFFIYKFLI